MVLGKFRSLLEPSIDVKKFRPILEPSIDVKNFTPILEPSIDVKNLDQYLSQILLKYTCNRTYSEHTLNIL